VVLHHARPTLSEQRFDDYTANFNNFDDDDDLDHYNYHDFRRHLDGRRCAA